MNIKQLIDDAVSEALARCGAEGAPAVIRQAQRAEFGHYQANGIMGAAKKLGVNPRELATDVVAALDLPQASTIEVAGPGFINIHLAPQFLVEQLTTVRASRRLDIATRPKQTIVIDYSAPNLMKEMHIGHLRPNCIGDTLARLFDFLDQNVIRANHVGDWGAQLGSLLAYLDALNDSDISTELKDLEKFYQAASALFKSDPEFAARARENVVKLQRGDKHCLALWERFINESIDHCQTVYDILDITLTRDDIAAESSYNDALPVVVSELTEKGLITESDGALCVFMDEFKGKDGNPLPAIVRKSDGGFGYMATDLAAVRHRTHHLGAHRVLYVVGAPQSLHFRQVFAVARAAGYILPAQEFSHLPFGLILQGDGKPFKTRAGANVKLIDVIEEAISRAFDLVTEKNPSLDEHTRRHIARVVGVGALKYAELSKNRITDYIFDWDTMLSFEGNTAPYLQYAYTRIRSIFKRAGTDPDGLGGDISVNEPAEIALAIKLLQFTEALDGVLEDYQPNVLCNYLYELSGIFMTFYEACPILKAADATRQSRLLLADITARTLNLGLGLLGIHTVDEM
ncbi:MAG TPA: arginine--tRNA ligase [Pseudomonadales bacterium]|nr:arginine--tRNA ligase [Pseudomonadales bacterium]